MATIMVSDTIEEKAIAISIYGFPKSLPTTSMNESQLKALESSKYEVTKTLGDLQFVLSAISTCSVNHEVSTPYATYRSSTLRTIAPLYITINYSTKYDSGAWTQPLAAMMPVLVDEGYYQVGTLEHYPDYWLDNDDSNYYSVLYYRISTTSKWYDTRDTSLSVHISRMKTMYSNFMTFFVNYQNDFKGNMYREIPYLIVRYLLQELLPYTTKTYTNSTWSTKKTWYIKVTFTKKSTSNDHSNPSNVVNYETMIQKHKILYIRVLLKSL